MEPLGLIVGVVLAAISLTVATKAGAHAGRERVLAARRLGLGYKRGPPARLYGDYNGFGVEVRVTAGRRARLEFSVRPVMAGITLAPARLLRAGALVKTGDATFDETIDVEGAATVALALLDADTRTALISAANDRRFRVEDGALHVELGGASHDAAEIVSIVERMVTLASHLAPGGKTKRERLLGNATADPGAGVRRKNLERLIDDHPTAPETRRACQQSLVDADASIVLLSARALGADGRPALEGLLVDSWQSAEIRLAALDSLDATGDRERVVLLAQRLLDATEPELRTRAIVILGGARHRASGARIAALVESVAGAGAHAEEEAIAGALGAMRDPASEPALLTLLGRETPAVRVAAAAALGACGTTAAVEALRTAMGGHFLDRHLHAVCGTSIAAIQARAEGAAAGQVSIAEADEAGKVSLAAITGALSIKGRS